MFEACSLSSIKILYRCIHCDSIMFIDGEGRACCKSCETCYLPEMYLGIWCKKEYV